VCMGLFVSLPQILAFGSNLDYYVLDGKILYINIFEKAYFALVV
jgi:hypothetical protein